MNQTDALRNLLGAHWFVPTNFEVYSYSKRFTLLCLYENNVSLRDKHLPFRYFRC